LLRRAFQGFLLAPTQAIDVYAPLSVVGFGDDVQISQTIEKRLDAQAETLLE